jgi:hypothetical protein
MDFPPIVMKMFSNSTYRTYIEFPLDSKQTMVGYFLDTIDLGYVKKAIAYERKKYMDHSTLSTVVMMNNKIFNILSHPILLIFLLLTMIGLIIYFKKRHSIGGGCTKKYGAKQSNDDPLENNVSNVIYEDVDISQNQSIYLDLNPNPNKTTSDTVIYVETIIQKQEEEKE